MIIITEVTLINTRDFIKASGEHYLVADFQIEEGARLGERVSVGIDLDSHTGLKQLGKIAMALGKPVFEDTLELHGLVCNAHILLHTDSTSNHHTYIVDFKSLQIPSS